MIHENARDLLLLMLKINPQERISSQAVLEHPFFAEGLREAKADGDKIEGPKTESHESAMVGRENAIVGRDRYPA
jgi:serine/threonine protein kinase